MYEDLKVGRIVLIAVVITIILNGGSNSIKPIKVIKTDFDLSEAENLMKKTWKPIHEMKNANLEIKPDIKIASKEEFFETYDFSYMGDRIRSSIFDSIVDIVEEDDFICYIPTIHDNGVFIKKAYIRDCRYKEEYAFLNAVELVVEENSNDKTAGPYSRFYRINIFRKNEEGQWFLYRIKGVMLIGE
ncbi:hypothetical protein IZY60_13315 [Lutibacter sp. B2]|nr:hypothetical protein [Lutibacter sp. B2]